MSLRVASAPEGVLPSLLMEKRSPINTQEHWATRRGMRRKSSSLTGSSPAPAQSRESACTFINIRVGILGKPLLEVVRNGTSPGLQTQGVPVRISTRPILRVPSRLQRHWYRRAGFVRLD